ncbi:kinase-like protein, partial [Thelephora ganbajun]
RVLRKTCAEAGVLPSSYYLDDGQIKKLNDVPFASGGYSDVWRALYKEENVSIKAFRVYTTDNIKYLNKAWCKEIVVCQNLSHPNILPFLGVISTDSHPLSIVSKWMSNGNISEFLKHDVQFNRRPLLIDIARGLDYLHSQNVIHGDLKGPNILIDDNKNAVLCDFGMASITADAESAHASTTNSAGSIRWMAPERLSIFDGTSEPARHTTRVTKESDMYSLAMVVVEIFAGHTPFSDVPDAGVILKLSQQKRPNKPEGAVQLGLTNPIWETVETCWKTRPSDR